MNQLEVLQVNIDFFSTTLFDEYINHPNRFSLADVPDEALLYLFLHDEPKLKKNRSIKTKKEYFRDLRSFLQFAFLHGGLRHLTPALVASYQRELDKDYADATLLKRTTVVKQFLRYLQKLNVFTIDLTTELKQVGQRPDLVVNRDMYDHETKQILIYLEQHDFLLYVLFLILTSTGMRIFEVAHAKWSDVFYYPPTGLHYISIVGKNNKPRDIPLQLDTFSYLCEYRNLRGFTHEISPSDPTAFFPKSNGQHYNSSYLSTRFVNALQQSDLPFIKYRKDPITPHTCRHFFASWLDRMGASMRAIQDALDHSQSRTTERYLLRNRRKEEHATMHAGPNFLSTLK